MAPDRRAERRAALAARLAQADVDAAVVTSLPNIRYLSGFTGTAGLLLLQGAEATLITDFRYAEQAPAEVGDGVEVLIDRVNVWDRLATVIRVTAPETLGFEEEHLTVRDARRLSDIGPTLAPLRHEVERLRVAKDEEEVAAIRAAADLATDALAEVLPTIRAGETELDVAARLEAALRVRGSEWHPFRTIVASGPRSALPHARTTDRVLAAGDLVLLDFGAEVRGYCADLARTVVLGAPANPRQREIYEVVRVAQEAARSGVRAGMSGRAADAIARDRIAAAGYGEAFGHALGHGLGLEVHEAPRLAPTSGEPLPLHAVVTVEPGVYLPGWGGVRLEDDLWVGPEGPVSLSNGRTDLIELL